MQFSDIITFTRASGGGRFNAQGQYEWLPANQPRIDYDPVTGEAKGLLIEEQRTNLLTYSEQFDNAAWGGVNGGTYTPDNALSPDGTIKATLIDLSASSTAYVVLNGFSTSSAATVCYSFFVKGVTGETVVVKFNTNAQATVTATDGETTGTYIATKLVTLTGAWQRVSIYVAMSAAVTSGYLYLGDRRSGQTAQLFHVWGAQLEAGAFPTSYIPTTNAQVTRAADEASVNELSPWFNASEGTFVIESTNRQRSTGGTFGLSIGSSSSNYIGTPYHTNSVVVAWLYSSVGGVSKNIPNGQNQDKIAFSYGSDGVITLVAGGVRYGSTTHAALPSFSSLFIGRGHFGGAVATARYKSVRYFPRRLSVTELQALTA